MKANTRGTRSVWKAGVTDTHITKRYQSLKRTIRKQWIGVLRANVPHPAISNLIFYPEGDEEVTPEEVIEKAFAYTPLITPPPPKDA